MDFIILQCKLECSAFHCENIYSVTIEVNSARGIRFVLVGLPDNAVKESHERITAALENSGFPFPCKPTPKHPLPFWGL